jgi:hypothetical protein
MLDKKRRSSKLNMWRPFAGDFVTHTYNDFRRKMDKIWSAKPAAKREAPQKFDINSLFPYNIEDNDVNQRKEEFAKLQMKVGQQRKLIKRKEMEKQVLEKQKVETLNRENAKNKEELRKSLMRIRSMASNKIHRFRPSRSMEYAEQTFQMTSLTKKNTFGKRNTLISKNTLN